MRIAVLGAGHVGPVIARLAVGAGYDVSIAASGDPEEIRLIAEFLAPGAEVRWAADATREADLVVLAIPWHRFADLDLEAFAGKVVVDAMNEWPPAAEPSGTSELVAGKLSGARVVKTLNHIAYHEMEEPRRRALGVAGDDAGAVDLVAQFVERLGFEAVLVGGLEAGRVLEPAGPVFGSALTTAEFEQAGGLS